MSDGDARRRCAPDYPSTEKTPQSLQCPKPGGFVAPGLRFRPALAQRRAPESIPDQLQRLTHSPRFVEHPVDFREAILGDARHGGCSGDVDIFHDHRRPNY